MSRVSPVPVHATGRVAAPRLASALTAWSRRGDIAGWQYLLTARGRVVAEFAGGLADAARGRAVTPDSTFNLYSISKTCTAAAAVVAAHRAQLDLDAPVAEACALPALTGFGSVREALLHRAGFPNPLPLRWVHAAEDDRGFDEEAFVDSRLQALRGRHGRRGRARYSNLGYLAAGRAVARSAGVGFRQALQRSVLDGLVAPPGGRLGFAVEPALHAHGLLRRGGWLDLLLGWLVDRDRVVECRAGRWLQLRLHQVNGSAYGGLVGNARGLAGFGHAVLGLAPPWPSTVRAALLAGAAGHGPRRTLAFFEGCLLGERWLGHAGGGLGGCAEFRLYPARQAVSVLLTNTPGLRDQRWLDSIDAAWLVEDVEHSAWQPHPAAPVSADGPACSPGRDPLDGKEVR